MVPRIAILIGEHPTVGHIQPQRQLLEPLDQIGVIIRIQVLCKKLLMLLNVLVRVPAKILAGFVRIRREIGNGIEFVIAHHR